MRYAVLLLTTFMLAACASNGESVTSAPVIQASAIADWEKWRADENAAWSTNKFAILKIDDAVYLKDGQTAYLTNRKQKMLEYRWTFDRRSAPLARVTFKGGKAQVWAGKKKQSFTLEKLQNVALREGADLRFGLTQLDGGTDGLRVMVYNQEHPAAKHFAGLEHFPYDPNAVVEATFEAAPSLEAVDFQTSRGWLKRINRVGYASFKLYGKPVKVGMFSDEKDPAKVKQLSTFFLDELSGKETYGVGRYIDIDVDGLPKTLMIDFNRAYNPNCARSPHYNCPLAIDKIPLAVRAGEKIPPKH